MQGIFQVYINVALNQVRKPSCQIPILFSTQRYKTIEKRQDSQ